MGSRSEAEAARRAVAAGKRVVAPPVSWQPDLVFGGGWCQSRRSLGGSQSSDAEIAAALSASLERRGGTVQETQGADMLSSGNVSGGSGQVSFWVLFS